MTYYGETWFDRHFGKIVVGAFVLFVIIISAAINHQSNKVLALYDQCVSDGKKEYECYALIYRGSR